MWDRLSAFWFFFDLALWLGVELKSFCLPVDLLPDLCGFLSPFLQLLLVQLVDAEMMLWICSLPFHWIKVRYQRWYSIWFDGFHLFVGLQNVLHHKENVLGGLLIFSQSNNPGPPQAFEGLLNGICALW